MITETVCDNISNHSCAACKLGASARSICVSPRGIQDARLLIIGEAPGKEEDSNGMPFIGASGRLLDEMLAAASISDADVRVSNSVRCIPTDNYGKTRKPSKEEMEACEVYLCRELQMYPPDLIVTMGATALAMVIGYSGITKHRGRVYEYEVPDEFKMDGCKHGFSVLPTIHPAAVLHGNVGYQELIVNDLDYAKQLIYGTATRERDITYVDDLNMLDVIVDSYIDRYNSGEFECTATDIETNMLDMYHPRAKVVSIGVAPNECEAFVVPVKHKSSPFKKDVLALARIANSFQRLYDNVPTGGQYFQFDYKFMHEVAGIKIPPHMIVFDTMLGSIALHMNTVEHNLEALSARYLNIFQHKTQMRDVLDALPPDRRNMYWADLPTVVDYNADDCMTTIGIRLRQKPMLEEIGVYESYMELMVRVIPAICQMELNGVYFDNKPMKHAAKEFEIFAEEVMNFYRDQGLVDKIEKITLKPFKITSNTDQSVIIYDLNDRVPDEYAKSPRVRSFEVPVTDGRVMVKLSRCEGSVDSLNKAKVYIKDEKYVTKTRPGKLLKDGDDYTFNIYEADSKLWVSSYNIDTSDKDRRYQYLGVALSTLPPEGTIIHLKLPCYRGKSVRSQIQLSYDHALGVKFEGIRTLKTTTEYGRSDHISKTTTNVMATAIKYLLDYKAMHKLYSTYLKALPKHVKSDGCIHTTYNVGGAKSGRLSSNNPNMQNIPWRSVARSAFVSRFEHGIILKADYSQLELRLMAMLSKDKKMIEAFMSGQDVHMFTASNLFKKPIGKINTGERRIAKVISFGTIYGVGAERVSHVVNISIKEARGVISAFHDTFPDVSLYISRMHEEVTTNGYVYSPLGRRYLLPHAKSGINELVGKAKRQSVNLPIQGTGSDLGVLASTRTQDRLWGDEGFESLAWAFVHDEICMDVVPGELIPLVGMLGQEFHEAPQTLYDWTCGVPLPVEYEIGASWGECLEMNPEEGGTYTLKGKPEYFYKLYGILDAWDCRQSIVDGPHITDKETGAIKVTLQSATHDSVSLTPSLYLQ